MRRSWSVLLLFAVKTLTTRDSARVIGEVTLEGPTITAQPDIARMVLRLLADSSLGVAAFFVVKSL
jgi:hypothetical protein